MTGQDKPSRDEVLLAFHEACDVPSADDIVAWVGRYPQFADDIREHAAIRRDWAGERQLPERKPDDVDLARARSRALNALHAARAAAQEPVPQAPVSFDAMMRARAVNVRAVARQLDIGVDVLGDMISGVMLAPVGPRLVDAWTAFFAISRDAFDVALEAVQGAPRLGYAKASGEPTVVRRTYEDIVRSSPLMSDERIRFWLGET